MLLFIVGVSATAATAYFGYKDIKANRKKHKMYQYVNYLTKDMKTNESIRDAFLIGAGSTAISVFSIYNAVENHAEILETMEYRFPNELMDYSPLDWLNKIEQLYKDGDQAINGFINGYSGQAAEHITVEQFEAMGATATLFESRTHPNDDIAVTMDGETIHYSIKSYADANSFAQTVNAHPDSTHYVVNEELYKQLSDRGLLAQYEEQGLTIIEGNYSNVALREEASQAFLELHEAADVGDYIPFISIPLYAIRSGFNVKAYREGKQSGHELSVNMIGDAGKIGVASGFGFGGAKIGGLIGTAIFPGIGTVIGGGIGAVLGVFSGSKVMESIKHYFKWGKIIAVQEAVGKTFSRQGLEHYTQYYREHIFSIKQINDRLANGEELASRYSNKLDLYCADTVTLPAVLQQMFVEHTAHVKAGVLKAAEQLPHKIDQFAAQCASKVKSPKAKHAFIGELLLQSESPLWMPADKQMFKQEIEQYELEANKNPNHPYQFQLAADDILEQMTEEVLQENLKPNAVYTFLEQEGNKYRRLVIVLAIIALATLFAFFVGN